MPRTRWPIAQIAVYVLVVEPGKMLALANVPLAFQQRANPLASGGEVMLDRQVVDFGRRGLRRESRTADCNVHGPATGQEGALRPREDFGR